MSMNENETIKMNLIASQNVKYPIDVIIANGRMKLKLLKEGDNYSEIIEFSNDIIVKLNVLCVKSVWRNVKK